MVRQRHVVTVCILLGVCSVIGCAQSRIESNYLATLRALEATSEVEQRHDPNLSRNPGVIDYRYLESINWKQLGTPIIYYVAVRPEDSEKGAQEGPVEFRVRWSEGKFEEYGLGVKIGDDDSSILPMTYTSHGKGRKQCFDWVVHEGSFAIPAKTRASILAAARREQEVFVFLVDPDGGRVSNAIPWAGVDQW